MDDLQKIEYNRQPVTDKDFTDLSAKEIEQLITDGRLLELKQTPSNVQSNYRKAKHQATDVLIHIKSDVTKENALEQIRRAKRS